MTQEEVDALEVGEIVKHESGLTFIVFNTTEDVPQVMTSIHIEDPREWEKVEREK
jgi:hypothetical protein